MKMIYDTTDLRGLFVDDDYQYYQWVESRLKRSVDTSEGIQWDIDTPNTDEYPLGI
jgi:hypothetical protein